MKESNLKANTIGFHAQSGNASNLSNDVQDFKPEYKAKNKKESLESFEKLGIKD